MHGVPYRTRSENNFGKFNRQGRRQVENSGVDRRRDYDSWRSQRGLPLDHPNEGQNLPLSVIFETPQVAKYSG